MKQEYAIEVNNITKKFGDFTAVDDISFKVKKGEVFAILGPNGAGKTTTVRMLSTLIRPNSGVMTINNYDVVKEPKKVREQIGLTGQYASVDEELTAQENLEIFCRLNGLTKKQTEQRIDKLLKEFSLEFARNRALKKFSGGMRRRLDLAVSLIAYPDIIFLDEPTTGLDPRNRGEMWETIQGLVARGSTVILTTQYLEEADQLADRIIIIDHGKIIAEGTANELKQSIGTSTVQISIIKEELMDTAKQILEKLLQEEVEIVVEENLLIAPMTKADLLTDILVEYREAGIEVNQLAIRQPSLDEVFLSITNK